MMLNGLVRCTHSATIHFKKDGVYKVKDGMLIGEYGEAIHEGIKDIGCLNIYLRSKFILLESSPPKLKVGQVVEQENGVFYFVLEDRLIGRDGWTTLDFNEELESKHDSEFNIKAIYNAPIKGSSAWHLGSFSKNCLELVWEKGVNVQLFKEIEELEKQLKEKKQQLLK